MYIIYMCVCARVLAYCCTCDSASLCIHYLNRCKSHPQVFASSSGSNSPWPGGHWSGFRPAKHCSNPRGGWECGGNCGAGVSEGQEYGRSAVDQGISRVIKSGPVHCWDASQPSPFVASVGHCGSKRFIFTFHPTKIGSWLMIALDKISFWCPDVSTSNQFWQSNP